MAIVFEKPESGSGKDGQEQTDSDRSLKYLVALAYGETIADAKAAVAPWIFDAVDDLYLQDVDIRPTAEPFVIEFEARYSNKEPKKPEQKEGEDEITIDCMGGREKIYYSRATINRYGRDGAVAPRFFGGINVTKSGIEGVDILVPEIKISITRVMKDSSILDKYTDDLDSLVGKVNDAAVKFNIGAITKEFALRELRFDGYRVQRKSTKSHNFAFNFTASKSESNFVVGVQDPADNVFGDQMVVGGVPGRRIPLRCGWDFLWILAEDDPDADAGTTVQRPKAVYIEQVYAMGDFRKLKL